MFSDSGRTSWFKKSRLCVCVCMCSWGPSDDGTTVDGPQHITTEAMRHGVEFGRRGYGAVYVVASGNGGVVGDNCNYDGYANMVYTVTIGAVGEDGAMPYYAEECASMLAVTFSSSAYHRSIVSSLFVCVWLEFPSGQTLYDVGS